MRFTLDDEETKRVTLEQQDGHVMINVDRINVAFFDAIDQTLSIDHSHLNKVGLTVYEI